MTVFVNENNILTEIPEIPFKLEKDLQKLIEKNTKMLFGLDFVRTEFELNGLRIDSLAFDRGSKSFVIIEYKKDKNFSVIDQGYSYLSLMLKNKAEFVLAYNEKSAEILKKDDIDWSQSRVIFVSPVFTTYQRQAVELKDLPIELWEVKKYENNTIVFNQIQSKEKHDAIAKFGLKNEIAKSVAAEIKTYTEDYLLESATDEIKKLYRKIKEQILSNFDNVSIKPRKHYVGFVHRRNFVDIVIQKSSLKVVLNLGRGQLDDPRKLARDVSNLGHFGNGDHEISLSDDKDTDYVFTLIKQSFEKN